MTWVFDRLPDKGLDNTAIDWLVFAAGAVVLAVSVASGLAQPGFG